MPEKSRQSDYVILLHGLSRGPKTMLRLSKLLTKEHYEVHNIGYPATSHSIDDLVDHVNAKIQNHCRDLNRTMHFVTYSLGGIIARELIAKYRPQNLGRVVMIAPPHKGSEVVDVLQRFKLFKKRFGPAGVQLGTVNNDVQRVLSIDYPLGIIAGNRTIDPWFSWFILPGKGDGKVTIESTKIEGMHDHIIIHGSHTFLPRKKETLRQVLYFLKHGTFRR